MDYLPIFLDLRGRTVLVAGGGHAVVSKVALVLRAGAGVTVVAPTLSQPLAALAAAGRIRHVRRCFVASDLAGISCVVASTGDPGQDERIHAQACNIGIPVNVVDCPALSSFIFPAIVDRSPVVVAISTGGAAPVLARMLRGWLEGLIPHGIGRLAAVAGRYRERVHGRLRDPVARRRFWEAVFDGVPVAEALASKTACAESLVEDMLERAESGAPAKGEIYIVAAGAGSPDQLTLRALRQMQRADIVLHDTGVSVPVLDLVRRDAERIVVGTCDEIGAIPCADVGRLMARLAGEGRRVLRLTREDSSEFVRDGALDLLER